MGYLVINFCWCVSESISIVLAECTVLKCVSSYLFITGKPVVTGKCSIISTQDILKNICLYLAVIFSCLHR